LRGAGAVFDLCVLARFPGDLCAEVGGLVVWVWACDDAVGRGGPGAEAPILQGIFRRAKALR